LRKPGGMPGYIAAYEAAQMQIDRLNGMQLVDPSLN
jgi:hypothetical protein